MKKLIYILPFLLILSSCMDDDVLRDFERLNANHTERGVFVVNEGNFMYENASLSYYNINDNIFENNVFYRTNALPLGDVAQSMTIRDSLGYIVINNSGKIYIININTFKYIGKITGFTSPRNIVFISDEKAYVSDLYSKCLYIVNLKTRQIAGSVDLSATGSVYAHTSESMVVSGDKLFVSSWNFDDKILVVNTINDEITDTLDVTLQPNSMVIDKNNKLWVLCDGGNETSPVGYENPTLIRINPETLEIEKTLTFDDINGSPTDLCMTAGKDTLYFIFSNWGGTAIEGSGVYRMAVTSEVLPSSPVIPENGKLFYSMGIDPINSDIYVGDASNYSSNGRVLRFRHDCILIYEFEAGIAPGGFCFK
ncbi:MAG TPA: cell surface protein [Bacteroidales bacterium]|nr:cell surface protein [Bacteroidales bacterium]